MVDRMDDDSGRQCWRDTDDLSPVTRLLRCCRDATRLHGHLPTATSHRQLADCLVGIPAFVLAG